MSTLIKDASKKEDKVFRGVSHIVGLVDKMISPNPEERPTAKEVQEKMHNILSQICGLSGNQSEDGDGKPKIHCEPRKIDQTNGTSDSINCVLHLNERRQRHVRVLTP
jgi:hypothetical protein